MAHEEQRAFARSVKTRYPQYFESSFVLDIGSLDINGNNHYLLSDSCLYLGVDVGPGRNIDMVAPAHMLAFPDETFDLILSMESLEHDKYWDKTLENAVRMLKPGGLLMITCATTGRPEHGTKRTNAEDAPLLGMAEEEWGDYYRNIVKEDVELVVNVSGQFRWYEFSGNDSTCDLYFYGIKNGIYSKRDDRSVNLATHPFHVEKRKLHELLEVERNVCASKDRELSSLQIENDNLQSSLESLLNSKSWRVTQPMRNIKRLFDSVRPHVIRFRNGMKYLLSGDIEGFRVRYRLLRRESLISRLDHGNNKLSLRWGILATPHTLFVAHLVRSQLEAHGWVVTVFTEAPRKYNLDFYIVICPQMFKKLPPCDKRIVYQMEQSVSTRWFTDQYIHILENSLCVLDYSLRNIEYLSSRGIIYPHVYYLPVGADVSYGSAHDCPEKCYDVLFYGDSKSSARRRDMLEFLQSKVKVKIINELFGDDIVNEIRRAKVVINLHYYENALLEMPRIQECLSLGVPVVSEITHDYEDYPELAGAVFFFPVGDKNAMVETVLRCLEQPIGEAPLSDAVLNSARRFRFMLDRVLVGLQLVSPNCLFENSFVLPDGTRKVALSMPETISRRQIYCQNSPRGFHIFDGIRYVPGWIGCGLSYAFLASYALKNNLDQLMIIEDDVLLPDDFDHKLSVVTQYLVSVHRNWDIFAGVIASLHDDVAVTRVESFAGLQFVTINKMVSMVCNIYSFKALQVMSSWDYMNDDKEGNTIDKLLESQDDLQIVVTLPFLVGHREELCSTLWGFNNTQYRDMILKSENILKNKVDIFLQQQKLM